MPLLPWHQAVATRLLEQGLPQSLMLTGRVGDGLTELCQHLAERHLVGDSDHAQQLFANDEHPDYHLLTREETSTGTLRQHILIKQIRDLIEVATLMPVLASHRVAVIVPACRLNRSAANALLKLLEEPPPATLLILGVEKIHWLPATIRSRCRLVRVPSPSTAEALDWLKEQQTKHAEQALALADGAPLDAATAGELIPAQQLLGEFCTGTKPLVGPQALLDKLEPAIWLPWAIAWATAGVKLALGLPVDNNETTTVAHKVHKQAKPAVMRWLQVHAELLEMHSFATHPVAKRLLLERTTWLFTDLQQ